MGVGGEDPPCVTRIKKYPLKHRAKEGKGRSAFEHLEFETLFRISISM